MQATYSSVNKTFWGIKAILLAFLFHFISPFLVMCSLPTNSEHHSIVRGLIASILIFVVEFIFHQTNVWMNSSEIKRKLKNTESQISDLNDLLQDETDDVLIRRINTKVRALKKLKVDLSAGEL